MTKIEETVERMKAEILADVLAGRVPDNVESFGELHDYVDANCYGGFCEDDYELERDANGDITQAQVDFFNACQGAIDEWIRTKAMEAEMMRRCGDVENMSADDLLQLVYELRGECWSWANRYKALRNESITRR